MRRLSLFAPFCLFALLSLACAGGAESAAPSATATVPAPATVDVDTDAHVGAEALTVMFSSTASQTPELIDVSPSGRCLAMRIPTMRDDQWDWDVAPRCVYPGLDAGVDGMEIALIDFDADTSTHWTVYRRQSENNVACTSDADARAQLTLAKAAMMACGLDPSKRLQWLPPEPFDEAPRDIARPSSLTRAVRTPSGDALNITLEHTSDSGYHTYTAAVAGSGGTRNVTHSPNPAMAGAGDLEVRGAITSDGGTTVLLEATHGPASIWSNWVVTAPL